MQIPTEADWRSEPWWIDTPSAYKNFFGLDMEAAIQLFVKNALDYQEDILFMPLACFRFYMHAYISYLLSPASKDDSDGASCFFGIVERRLDDIQKSDANLIERVKEVLVRLKDNQKWYDADEKIYGNFKTKAETHLKNLTS